MKFLPLSPFALPADNWLGPSVGNHGALRKHFAHQERYWKELPPQEVNLMFCAGTTGRYGCDSGGLN